MEIWTSFWVIIHVDTFNIMQIIKYLIWTYQNVKNCKNCSRLIDIRLNFISILCFCKFNFKNY